MLRHNAPKGIRRLNRTVVEHDRGATSQSRKLPVPHHPAGRSLKEKSILRSEVTMQPMLLHMFQQGTARATHDAFRHSGRTGTEHHKERMIERHAWPDRKSTRLNSSH